MLMCSNGADGRFSLYEGLGAEYGGDWGQAAAAGTRAITEAIGAGFQSRSAARSAEAHAAAIFETARAIAPWIGLSIAAIAIAVMLRR